MAEGLELAALRRRLSETASRRREVERELNEQEIVTAAIGAVRRDLHERSSPELRRAQQRLDAIRTRLVDRRHSMNTIGSRLRELTVAVENLPDDAPHYEAVTGLMRSAEAEAFSEAFTKARQERARTDQLGAS